MRQDDELIRLVLMAVADSGVVDGRLIPLDIPGYTDEQIAYHVYLLSDAGMLEAVNASSFSGYAWMAKRLTWEGQKYLKAISNQAVWQRVVQFVKDKGGSAPMEVLQALAIEFAKDHFLTK